MIYVSSKHYMNKVKNVSKDFLEEQRRDFVTSLPVM